MIQRLIRFVGLPALLVAGSALAAPQRAEAGGVHVNFGFGYPAPVYRSYCAPPPPPCIHTYYHWGRHHRHDHLHHYRAYRYHPYFGW